MNIGKRIKDRRIELGMSADTLAELLGKNRSTIYRYENGEIENMPIDAIKPIADALKTTPSYLLGWSDVEWNPTTQEITIHDNDKKDIDRLLKYQEMYVDSKYKPLIDACYRVKPENIEKAITALSLFE